MLSVIGRIPLDIRTNFNCEFADAEGYMYELALEKNVLVFLPPAKIGTATINGLAVRKPVPVKVTFNLAGATEKSYTTGAGADTVGVVVGNVPNTRSKLPVVSMRMSIDEVVVHVHPGTYTGNAPAVLGSRKRCLPVSEKIPSVRWIVNVYVARPVPKVD